VTKNYQTRTSMTSAELRLALPETVTVAMGEIAENVQEGLLAVGTGLQVMQTIMAEDVTAVCGPKGKHDPARRCVMAPNAARSPSAGVGCRSNDRGCVLATARASCRCRPMNCSPAPRSWAGRRWPACSLACPPAVTRSGSNRSVSGSSPRPRRRASPRSRAGSSRPRPHWASCSPHHWASCSPHRWVSWTWWR